MSPLTLGMVLLAAGLSILLLTLILLRVIRRREPISPEISMPNVALELNRHAEAVLLVQAGGRIVYHNQAAQKLFGLNREPNLDWLGRRARPSEAFWGLCAAEGQARFVLDDHIVQGVSYAIPYGKSRAMLVTLQRPQLLSGRSKDGDEQVDTFQSTRDVSFLTEIVQAMASSLDLDSTLRSIIEAIQHLIPSDRCEISLWDPENRCLTSYRLTGAPGSERGLEKGSPFSPSDMGYAGFLVVHRQPLLIGDVDIKSRPAEERLPFRSFLGIALEADGDLVGTLELASLGKDSFTENDLLLLRMLSGQAALALRNAISYKVQERRAHELSGLAELAQVVSAQREPQDVYIRLGESIAPLLEVEILGFWVLDEELRVLKGQIPFLGIQQTAIEWTQVRLQPDSEAEKLWLSQEIIIANDAQGDGRIQALGMEPLAVAAGLRHTVLVPLSSGGHMLGYMQVGDKRDGSLFDQNDLRLLSIIAGQVAPMIENLGLMQQSRRRAQRAETLRRIASLTASTATLEEIIRFSIQDLARLLQADMGFVMLLDDNRGELRLDRASLFGIDLGSTIRLEHLPVDDPEYPFTATGSQKPIMVADMMEETGVIPSYRTTAINLNGRSMVCAPLIVRQHGVGEIILISKDAGFFHPRDLQTIEAAAGQLAGAIEREALYTQTDESLRVRVDQLTALTRINRELNTTLQLESLLQRVLDESLRTTRADCGSILLFELRGAEAETAPPAEPRILLQMGERLPSGLHPLERMARERGETLIVNEFTPLLDLMEASNVGVGLVPPVHEGIQSAMIVPIAYQEQIAGLIHLHSRTPFRFDGAAREIAETLAIQAAIAIGNAQRYQEQLRRNALLNRRVETLAKLFETSQALQLELPLEQALENIAYAIQSATPFNIVVISVYDSRSQRLKRIANAGLSLADMDEMRAHPQPWDSLQQVLKPEFQIGRSYFIPYEKMPVMPPDVYSLIVQPLEEATSQGAGREEQMWQLEDALVVPLFSAQGDPVGLISVDAPRDNLRPDRPSIETLEIFGNQATLVIESQRKLSNLKGQLDAIQEELDVAFKAATAQNAAMSEKAATSQKAAESVYAELPVLVQKDAELAQSVHRLSLRAARFRAGIDLIEIANRQSDRLSVLRSLAGEILKRMKLDMALIVEAGQHGPTLMQTLGTLPPGINVESLIGQRNPLYQCLQTGEQILVHHVDGDADWSGSQLIQALHAAAFVCFPILSGGQPEAAILAASRAPLEAFTEEDEQLFTLISRQVGITLQNLRLLTETSQRWAEVDLLLDFNRRLGGLDPSGISQTLADSIVNLIPAGQAVMVALWDEHSRLLVPRAIAGTVTAEPLLEIAYRSGEALPGQVYASGQPIILDEVDFAHHYSLSSENLLRYRNATGGRLPVSCLAVPIQPTEGSQPLGVIVVDNFQEPASFKAEEQALVTSLAQQAALKLENVRLLQAAEERASQLQALTGVATTITSNLLPEYLISRLLDLLGSILSFDTGTLWLRETEDQMVVRAARGFADNEERAGLTAALEDSALLSQMIATGQPIAVDDVRSDPRFPSLVEPQYLSWLGVPLIAGGELMGVIALEKAEAGFYKPEHSQMAKTFASQAAVTLENARLYQESLSRTQELFQRSQRLGMLNRLSAVLSSTLEVERILDVTAQELERAIRCTGVSVVLFDSNGAAVLKAELPLRAEALPLPLPEAPLFERLRQTMGVFNSGDAAHDAELLPLADFLAKRNARSLLALALVAGSEAQGVLLAYSDRQARFSLEEVELARTISNQASIAIQNARLYAETRSLSEDLERRVVERTAQLEKAHQRSETLLTIITDLTTSLDLEQVLNRTLHLINQIVEAGQISVLLARPGEQKLHRLASLGYAGITGPGGITTPLNVDQGLAGWVISKRQPALIEDVRQDPRWILLSDAPEPAHRSALAVPLMVGAECLGALLLYHQEVGHFSGDQLDLVQAAANQVAIAVNNAELYRLIRDQAEDLGHMFRQQQVEASRARAILEAVADGVMVTDAKMNITLFNASAEQILGLERYQVIGRTLENFTGLFGRASQRWMETIRIWSQDPIAYQAGDIYTEQITLEDERVVSVHLSPVSLKESFLGTVSTFRDITHQVQLDRLKSEFVATVSHELRTPMTSIKGYVDILLMGAAGILTDQQSEFLEIVRNNTERLTVLVNDLLDISRIESGQVSLSLQPLDLEEVIAEALDALQRRSDGDRKPLQITVEPSEDLPHALGDRERVRQILDNLLENSYDYTDAGGRITVRVHPTGDEIEVDVQDNGIGIPPEAHLRIFERFYRGEHPYVLAKSGTGLGLSIVRHLVQMHGGRIWFESSGIPGDGSTFSFTLPVYQIGETVR